MDKKEESIKKESIMYILSLLVTLMHPLMQKYRNEPKLSKTSRTLNASQTLTCVYCFTKPRGPGGGDSCGKTPDLSQIYRENAAPHSFINTQRVWT